MGTTTSYDLGAHGLCYITTPPGFDPDAPDQLMILYAHGSGGPPNQWATLGAWGQMRNWCDANGWIVVEGYGGGINSWGNEVARADYLAYLEHAESLYDISVRVLLGRSMGGLITLWLHANSPRAADFDGLISNSGVSTMAVGGEEDSINYFTYLPPAYGETEHDPTLAKITAIGSAPEQWAGAVWNGKKILCCYGTADTSVPWATRGAGPLMPIWDGHATVTLSPKEGGDHSGSNGSYTDVAAMGAFLSQFMPDPPPPEERVFTRIKARFLKLADGVHPIHTTPLSV